MSAAPTGGTTQTPVPSGRWEAAASMTLGRLHVQAVRLGDGSVLVAGDDRSDCVAADSVATEVWTPPSAAWTAGPSLNAPRAEFALVPAGSGGALVVGGVNAGLGPDADREGHQSYSSTYLFSPAQASAGWQRQGLLTPARTRPIAARLADGRVLVMGGYYLSGAEGIETTVVLARCVPGGSSGSGTPLNDNAPPTEAYAYATASLFDPTSGSWSATGPMRYARVGSAAVTLSDGRVLVVGASTDGPLWNYAQPSVDAAARTNAEVWDPATGRFTPTGAIPVIDWSPLQQWGPYPVDARSDRQGSAGTLVALPGGDALLAGPAVEWYVLAVNNYGYLARTLRFHGATNSWSVVDVRIDEADGSDVVAGHSRAGMLAVALAGGQVLLAGGHVGEDEAAAVATAELYDPARDAFAPLPPLPQARSGATGVLLGDGSVLVMGGMPRSQDCPEDMECPCGSIPTGLPSTVRFVPQP